MSQHEHKPAVSGPLTGVTDTAAAGVEAGRSLLEFGSNAVRAAMAAPSITADDISGPLQRPGFHPDDTRVVRESASRAYEWARNTGTEALSPLVDLSPLHAEGPEATPSLPDAPIGAPESISQRLAGVDSRHPTAVTRISEGSVVTGGKTTVDVGGAQLTVENALDPLQGRIGGGVEAESELLDRDVSAGVTGGLDLGADLSVEAAGVGGKAGVDGVILEAGAGFEDRVGAPQQLEDGTWQVTLEMGAGVSAGLSVQEGGVTTKNGVAEVQTRTFTSKEAADDWADAVRAREDGASFLSTSDILQMKPGETASVDRSAILGGSYELSGPASPELGAGARYDSKQTFAMRDETTLEVSNVGGWSLEGSGGVQSWALGYVGSLGMGGEQALDAEIDLEQPGAAEALAYLQRWGTFPDPLPPGVTLSKKKDVAIETWGHESQLGTERLTTRARTEEGTLMRDGVQGDYAKGTRTESQERYAVFGDLPISSESHEVEAFMPEDAPSELRTRSDYTGQGAKTQVQDDLATGDVQKARAEYGYEDGTYTVETIYTSDDYGGLEDLSRRAAREKYGDLFTELEKKKGGRAVKDADIITDEHEQLWRSPELVEGLTAEEIDLGAVAEYVAGGGGEAVEMLRYNTQYETTHVSSPDSDALQGRDGYDAIEVQLDALDAVDASREDKQLLVEQIAERLSTLEEDVDSPREAVLIEKKHLLNQLRRAQQL